MWTVFTTVEDEPPNEYERSRHMVQITADRANCIAPRAAGFVGVLTVSFG
jgi:hypothetical protein